MKIIFHLWFSLLRHTKNAAKSMKSLRVPFYLIRLHAKFKILLIGLAPSKNWLISFPIHFWKFLLKRLVKVCLFNLNWRKQHITHEQIKFNKWTMDFALIFVWVIILVPNVTVMIYYQWFLHNSKYTSIILFYGLYILWFQLGFVVLPI